MATERVARIGVQIAAALGALHAGKIVHRDVKPGNILLDDQDFAKLTDFGISVWRQVTRTDDGSFSGTPGYAAPEVAAGRGTEASDVFSLGATLFAAVEGTPPFGTGEPDEVLGRVRRGEVLTMRNAGPLAPLLSRMLSPDPEKRPTTSEVRQQLQDIAGGWAAPAPAVRPATTGKPFWRRPLYQVSAALVLVAGVAVAVFVPVHPPSPEPTRAAVASTDLIGDERTVDPCAVLDRKALERFGPTKMDTARGNFNRCDILVNTGAKESVSVEAQLVRLAVNYEPGKQFDVIRESPSNSDECDRSVVLDDKYAVRITAHLSDPPASLCTIAETAVNTVREMAMAQRGPLPRRPTPLPADSLAQIDTCTLLDDRALATVLPAIDPRSTKADFGDWACKWYSPSGPTQIHLRYDQHAVKDPMWGQEIQVANHTAYVKLDPGTGTSCTVAVLHQPPGQQWRSSVDVMVLTVKGDRPGAEYCPTATSLSAAAAAKLPR